MEYTLDQSVLHLLHRAAQSANDLFASEVRSTDLTARQFIVLLAIASEEGASQTRLVSLTGIDRSTLADVVSRLQRKGLLHRQPAAGDGRAYAVHLTDDGRALLDSARPMAARIDAELLELLPPEARKAWLQSLRDVAEAEPKAVNGHATNGHSSIVASVI